MARGDGAAGMAAGMLVALFLATTALAGQPRYNLSVDGLACPFCAYGIEKELAGLDGVAQEDARRPGDQPRLARRVDTGV